MMIFDFESYDQAGDLAALLVKGTVSVPLKVLIVSSTFRKAKLAFDRMAAIVFDEGVEIVRGPDSYVLRADGASVIAFPAGNGDKVRGQRADVLIFVDRRTIPREIWTNMLWGSGANH